MRIRPAVLAAALSVIAGAAWAADLPPIKAAPAPANAFQYPQTSGVYWGIGTAGGAGSASITSTTPGVNPSSIVTDQIGVYGIVGYAWNVPNSAMFTAAEGWFGWTNFNGNAPGFSFSGPASFKQRLLVGAPTDQIMALIPTIFNNVTPPPFTPPTGITISSSRGYIAAAFNEDDVSANFAAGSNKVWAFTPEIDVGLLSQFQSGPAADTFAFVKFGNKAFCVGALAHAAGGCGSMSTTYGGGLALKW
jgi:hypothetical protein